MDEDLLTQLLATQSAQQQPIQAAPQPAPVQVAPTEQLPSTPSWSQKARSIVSNFGSGNVGTELNKQDEELRKQTKENYDYQKQVLADKEAQAEKVKNTKIDAANLPTFKELLKKHSGIDPELIDKMTPEGVQKMMPNISKIFDQMNDVHKIAIDETSKEETSRHNKATEAEDRRYHDLSIAGKGKDKEDKAEQLHGKSVDESIDTLSGLKRGANAGTFGMAAKRGLLSDDGLRVIKQIESGKLKSTVGVANELAANLAGVMTSGGHPAEGTIKAFVDKTFQGDINKAASYLASHPQDTIAKAFLKNMKEQYQGQKGFWDETRNEAIRGQYLKFKDRFEEYPKLKERWVNSIKEVFPDANLESTVPNEKGEIKTSSGFKLKVPGAK